MKLDEAIELLNKHVANVWITPTENLDDALRLGIEALKAQKIYRAAGFIRSDQLLPGETA